MSGYAWQTPLQEILPSPRYERQLFDPLAFLALRVWYGKLLLEIGQIYEGEFLLAATGDSA